MIGLAALVLLAGAAAAGSTPAAKPEKTPEKKQEKVETLLWKKIPEGTRMEIRGSFVPVVDYLDKAGVPEPAPAIRDLHVTLAKRGSGDSALPPKLTAAFTLLETAPVKAGERFHPSAAASRLRAVAKAIPPRAWLEAYSEDQGKLRIDGSASGETPIADFLKALAADACFKDVNLERAERGNATIPSTSFVLTMAAADCRF